MAVTWEKIAYADDFIPKSLLTEQGDIIYASGVAAPATLAHGAAGQALISGGHAANPAWGNVLTNPMTNVGDLIYGGAAGAPTRLADVAVGSYLRSGGVNTAPLWSTLILPNAATAYCLPIATAANTIGELAAVGATGEYLAGATGAIPAWATLNQAAVAGLTTASSPVFVTVKLSGLTDGYIPYHVADATGFANSPIYTDGTNGSIGSTTPVSLFELRKNTAGSVLGPRLTLSNYSSGSYASSSIDFANADVGGNDPQVRIMTQDNADWSSNLIFLTKTPGVITNSLAERMRITSAGNVIIGMGTVMPDYRMEMWTTGTGDGYKGVRVSADSGASGLYTLKARGTVGAETAPLLNDALMSLSAGGYANSVWNYSKALIQMKTEENWGNTAMGTYIAFSTTPNLSTTRAERMRINNAGNVGIGPAATAPLGVLCIDGGVHIGGMSAVADNNLLVDGEVTISSLTASVPVVSDANKVLSSVSYATFKSSLAIVQADVTGLTTGDGPTFDHVHMTNQIYRSVETNITASVTQTQAGAYGLTKDINAITVIATSYDTVRLPPAEAGRIVIVMNTVSGKYLQIFPASGDDLGNGVDISTSVLGTTVYTLIFVAYDNTHWRKQTNS